MNKEKFKQDFKDTVQMLGIAAAGGIVVMHINSFFKPTTTNAAPDQGIEHIVEKVDTIIPSDSIVARDKVRQLREHFLSGVRSQLPTNEK